MLESMSQYRVIRLVETAELTGLIVLAAALGWIGHKTTLNHPAIRRSSWAIATACFLVLLGIWIQQDRMHGEALSDLTIRGLLGACALFGAISILAFPMSAVYRATLQAGFRRCSAWAHSVAEWRSRRRQEKRRAREWLLGAKAREEQRIQAGEQAKSKATAQKRREEARASCEVFFVRHAFELRQRFTREMFDAFVALYLSDTLSPDYVERRAKDLKGVIQAHLEKVVPPRKTLAELARWFLDEKRQIEESGLGDNDRQLILAQLEERYVRLQENYLRSVNP
jgi:hypothetical protein